MTASVVTAGSYRRAARGERGPGAKSLRVMALRALRPALLVIPVAAIAVGVAGAGASRHETPTRAAVPAARPGARPPRKLVWLHLHVRNDRGVTLAGIGYRVGDGDGPSGYADRDGDAWT